MLGVEKILHSKLLTPGRNRRIQSIDKHAGLVYTGHVPDGRYLVSLARSEAAKYTDTMRLPIPPKVWLLRGLATQRD